MEAWCVQQGVQSLAVAHAIATHKPSSIVTTEPGEWRVREEIERSVERTVEEAERVLREQRKEEESAGPPARERDPHSAFKFSKSGEKDRREKQQFALKDVAERSSRAQNRTDQQRDKDARDAGQESEVQRETIHGFGAEDKRRAKPSIDDDQEPER